MGVLKWGKNYKGKESYLKWGKNYKGKESY